MARKIPEGAETSALYHAAIDALGAKRVSQALGISLSQTYRLARATTDVDPDGTGARSDLDRTETLVDLLAAYPEGRPVLVEWRAWFEAMFERALGEWRGDALTPDRFHIQVGRAIKEVGDAISRCQDEALRREDLRRGLRKEIREAIAEMEGLHAALDMVGVEQVAPRLAS
jgi:hypothetical protein